MSTVPIALEAFRTRCASVIRPRGFVEAHGGLFSYDTCPSGSRTVAKCLPIQRYQSTLSSNTPLALRRIDSSIRHGRPSRGTRAYGGNNPGIRLLCTRRDEARRSGIYAQPQDSHRHAQEERRKAPEKYDNAGTVEDRREVDGQDSGSKHLSRNSGEASTISTRVLAPPASHSKPFSHRVKDTFSNPIPSIRNLLTVADKSLSLPAPPPSSYIRGFKRSRRKVRGLRMSEAVDRSLEHAPNEGVRFDEQRMEQEVLDAVSTGNPHVVLRCLDSRSRSREFSRVLGKLPRSTFSELLRCLDPENFIGSIQRRSLEISPQAYEQLFTGFDNNYYMFTSTFVSRLWLILRIRLGSTSISLSDVRYLLKFAQVVGEVNFAKFLWKRFTTEGQGFIRPDVACYNNLMATICWSDVVTGDTRYRLRVIGYNIASRAKLENEAEAQDPSGHRVGGPHGIKNQVSNLFRSMLASGLAGDEETFCSMMIAFAREADLKSVEAILGRVWDIDVSELLNNPEFENAPKAYRKDSPFYPSERLLVTLAHAYGINNAIPVALRLVDYVSRQYSLVIPISVWAELLNWTHVLSIPRRKKSPPDSRSHPIGVDLDDTSVLDEPETIVTASETTGQLPPEAVTNLWNTMISEPYNVKPTLALYDRAIRSLLSRQQFGRAQRLMKDSTKCHTESVRKLDRAMAEVGATVAKHGRDELHQNRIRERNFLSMEVRQGRYYRRGWVRKLLKVGERNMRHRNPDWYCRGIPHILDEWTSYLPARINYATPTGTVTLWTGAWELNRYHVWHLCYGQDPRGNLPPVACSPWTLRSHRRSLVRLIGRRVRMNRDRAQQFQQRQKLVARSRRGRSTTLEKTNQDEGTTSRE
ncbi:mitochondrial ATPase expression-domain-containing protein [Amylocarpus encephaloides]|uniref:Mitochondrial ATPase expression-domain-containing protein n=1 Tax=Amylocarpus encephaloides TaxID=45428 RepID=A0A9P8C3Z2_9HELO|nr:mitochondrial ATPase expression-domain-containing protein [Amylocarpus encephaloides]